MIRTQISLHPNEYETAKKEAGRLGISMAEFFRRSLRLILPLKKDKPWMRYQGLVESGNPASGQEVDEIIYGQKD